MIFALVLSAIGGIMGLFGPMITQHALDDAIPNKNVELLLWLAGALIFTFVVGVIFTTIRSRIMINVSQNIIFDIRKDIFEHVWANEEEGDTKIVDVNVRRLSMKIEDDPSIPGYIQTVWGTGYMWCSTGSSQS